MTTPIHNTLHSHGRGLVARAEPAGRTRVESMRGSPGIALRLRSQLSQGAEIRGRHSSSLSSSFARGRGATSFSSDVSRAAARRPGAARPAA